MLKHHQVAKNSSKKKYQLPSIALCGYYPPATIETRAGPEAAKSNSCRGPEDYTISGALGTRRYATSEEFLEPMHIAFANLRADVPKAAEVFVRRYGVPFARSAKSDPAEEAAAIALQQSSVTTVRAPSMKRFVIDSVVLMDAQRKLRWAWSNDWDSNVRKRILHDDMWLGTKVNFDSSGFVVLKTEDPWTFICFLFLSDQAAGKLGICENPECPARYFRKKRKTQKICERGSCRSHAQRQYSLKSWNRIGNKRRTKKRARNRAKRKKSN